VALLLADGLRYAEVAEALAIGERQVRRHVAQAIARLGVRNANQLVAAIVERGIVAAAISATS
jgi:DNA-binding CsgD family transcriptional regulator